MPLILASAVLPAPTIVALLLLRSSIRSAFAWVAGMTTVRLVQGVLFGTVLTASEEHAGPKSAQYVLGACCWFWLLLYVKALRTAVGAEDEDAPPPTWRSRPARCRHSQPLRPAPAS